MHLALLPSARQPDLTCPLDTYYGLRCQFLGIDAGYHKICWMKMIARSRPGLDMSFNEGSEALATDVSRRQRHQGRMIARSGGLFRILKHATKQLTALTVTSAILCVALLLGICLRSVCAGSGVYTSARRRDRNLGTAGTRPQPQTCYCSGRNDLISVGGAGSRRWPNREGARGSTSKKAQ